MTGERPPDSEPPADRPWVGQPPSDEPPAERPGFDQPPPSEAPTEARPDQPTYYPQAPAAHYPALSPRPNSGLAIASLVLGLVGLVVSWFTFGIPSLIALIFGIVAITQTGTGPGRRAGRGMAVAGTILGGVILALGVWVSAALVYGIGSAVNEAAKPTTVATNTSAPAGEESPTEEPSPTPGEPYAAQFGQPIELNVEGEPAGSYQLDKPIVSARGGEYDPAPDNAHMSL